MAPALWLLIGIPTIPVLPNSATPCHCFRNGDYRNGACRVSAKSGKKEMRSPVSYDAGEGTGGVCPVGTIFGCSCCLSTWCSLCDTTIPVHWRTGICKLCFTFCFICFLDGSSSEEISPFVFVGIIHKYRYNGAHADSRSADKEKKRTVITRIAGTR